MQCVVSGKYITFIPVVREKEYLECIVTMSQKDQVRESSIIFNINMCIYIYIVYICVYLYIEYVMFILCYFYKQDSLKIGEELIKLGLGTTRESWVKLKDKPIEAYKKSLTSAQNWAVRRRNGYWHFIKQPTVLWKMQMFIIDKMKTLLPSYIVRRLDL